MDILPPAEHRVRPADGPTAAQGPARAPDTSENGFAQSVQDAAWKAGNSDTGARARDVRPLTAEAVRSQPETRPGVTPLTPGELDLRRTVDELQARRLANSLAGRAAAPMNIAGYPSAVLTYAGQLAALSNRAGFALPDASARMLSTPRRGPEPRAVKPVDPPGGDHSVHTQTGPS